jgi:hypothetical protein
MPGVILDQPGIRALADDLGATCLLAWVDVTLLA